MRNLRYIGPGVCRFRRVEGVNYEYDMAQSMKNIFHAINDGVVSHSKAGNGSMNKSKSLNNTRRRFLQHFGGWKNARVPRSTFYGIIAIPDVIILLTAGTLQTSSHQRWTLGKLFAPLESRPLVASAL